jgi:hypothetical protein
MEIEVALSMKKILGLAAVLLTFIAFIPYIGSIMRGTTKPHVFSWVIWGSTTFIVFLAQLADKGGAGSWSIGVSGVITLMVAVLAYYKKSDGSITTSDWMFFLLALSALPLWAITSNPLWAVVILTCIDTLGFFPSFRKAYSKPFEEQRLLYVLMSLRNGISILALEHYSLTTMLFPLVITAACLLFIVLITLRRKQLNQGEKS